MAAAPAASSSLLTLTRAFSPSCLVLSLAHTSLLWASSALLCGSPERQTDGCDCWGQSWHRHSQTAHLEGAGGGHEPRLSLIGFSR